MHFFAFFTQLQLRTIASQAHAKMEAGVCLWLDVTFVSVRKDIKDRNVKQVSVTTQNGIVYVVKRELK